MELTGWNAPGETLSGQRVTVLSRYSIAETNFEEVATMYRVGLLKRSKERSGQGSASFLWQDFAEGIILSVAPSIVAMVHAESKVLLWRIGF